MTSNLTIGHAVAALRRWWWALVLASVLGIGAALVLLANATPTYEAIAILGPKKDFLSSNRTPGGLGGLLGALQSGSTNADLVRLDLLVASDRLAQEIGKSEAFKRDLLAERWDDQNQRWKPRTGLGVALLGLTGFHQPDEPSVDDIRARLDGLVKVETQQQQYRVIRIRTADRRRSLRLLTSLIATTDSLLRQDDRIDIDQLISYSRDRLKAVTLSQQIEAVATTLLSLEQQRMYMLASRTYAFNYIQQGVAESRPSSPKPSIYLAIGAIFPPTLVILFMILSPKNLLQYRRDVQRGSKLASEQTLADPPSDPPSRRV